MVGVYNSYNGCSAVGFGVRFWKQVLRVTQGSPNRDYLIGPCNQPKINAFCQPVVSLFLHSSLPIISSPCCLFFVVAIHLSQCLTVPSQPTLTHTRSQCKSDRSHYCWIEINPVQVPKRGSLRQGEDGQKAVEGCI